MRMMQDEIRSVDVLQNYDEFILSFMSSHEVICLSNLINDVDGECC